MKTKRVYLAKRPKGTIAEGTFVRAVALFVIVMNINQELFLLMCRHPKLSMSVNQGQMRSWFESILCRWILQCAVGSMTPARACILPCVTK